MGVPSAEQFWLRALETAEEQGTLTAVIPAKAGIHLNLVRSPFLKKSNMGSRFLGNDDQLRP